jgi:hypothetical protein
MCPAELLVLVLVGLFVWGDLISVLHTWKAITLPLEGTMLKRVVSQNRLFNM